MIDPKPKQKVVVAVARSASRTPVDGPLATTGVPCAVSSFEAKTM